jgi:hypothetical protein
MLELGFIDKTYNVISIGAGCGIDYWGLHYALKEMLYDPLKWITYTGVDTINWNYRDNLCNDNFWFLNHDVNDWTELDWNSYNVVIFPKSIGEFSSITFNGIKRIFEKTSFSENKIVLISSMRTQNVESDTKRLEQLINVMEDEHKYKCLEQNKNTRWHFTNSHGLANIYSNFVYPDEIRKFITGLSGKCNNVKNNGRPCLKDCCTMDKAPILTNNYIVFQVIRMEKVCRR